MIENYGNVQAVLKELRHALVDLKENNKTYSVYVENTGLTDQEQVEVLETLGKGTVEIRFIETEQPVSWYETQFSGIWVGTFKNHRDENMLHTIEVCRYPELAGAYNEDIDTAVQDIDEWIAAASI